VFDSSGPEGKVRGTPQQIIEKYNQLARDAQLSNDRVAAENFQQHAEHYTRLLSDAQREIEARREEQERLNRERQAERDRERAERQEREAAQTAAAEEVSADNGDQDSGLVETPESQPKPKRAPRRKPKPSPAPEDTSSEPQGGEEAPDAAAE
jgi:sRNA-binding protein